MIEYLEDAIEADPSEEFPRGVREAGTYGHKTGDAMVDKWQVQAIQGEDIDFSEAFAPGELEAIKAASKVRRGGGG